MTSTRAAGAMLVLLAAVPSAEARRVARAVEVPERERYVIRPDREGTAKQLIADVGFFRPLDGGVIFDAISVERSRVVYLLHRVGQRPADPPLGRIELSPAGLAGFAARTSRSFAIHVEVAGREPAVEAALAAAVRSIGAHDDGDFFTYLGRPVRLRPLEVLGLTPFHPHALFLLVIVAVLVGAWLRATPPRVSWQLKTTHLLPALLQLLLFAYWGLYWPGVRQHLPLLGLQLAYAYLFDAAFSLARYRRWRAGLGPVPIVLSTNLFMQFPVENLYLSLFALSVALASRHLIRWPGGAHVFNPSAFGILVVGALHLARPALGDGDVSMELALPPNMTEVTLLLVLIVQLRLRITLIALSSAAALLLFMGVTGYTYFYPFWPPVFLVLTLVAGDPATTPRTGMGRLLFGSSLGIAMGATAAALEDNGLSDFYGKIMPIVLVNLASPAFDAIARRVPAAVAAMAGPRWNLAHVAIWVALVVWGVRAKAIAPEIHAFYETPLTARGPDGTISCESSPIFCTPFSFLDEARAWRDRR